MIDPTAASLCQRRDLLIGALALTPWLIAPALGQEDAASLPPQIGDQLAFLTGPKKGTAMRSEDLELGVQQLQAFPMDPSGVIRDGSRLNLLVVVKVGTEGLSDETKERAADGVVAYSGVCTHQACPVNMWMPEISAFICSCHGSTYDPKLGAEVLGGPAPRRLAALPLKSVGGVLTVSGKFTGKVGAQPV